MSGVRSVLVDGEPLTWTRLVELLGEDALLSPVRFSVARVLPRQDALQLQAWLVRHRIHAVVPVHSIASGTHRLASRGHGPDPSDAS